MIPKHCNMAVQSSSTFENDCEYFQHRLMKECFHLLTATGIVAASDPIAAMDTNPFRYWSIPTFPSVNRRRGQKSNSMGWRPKFWLGASLVLAVAPFCIKFEFGMYMNQFFKHQILFILVDNLVGDLKSLLLFSPMFSNRYRGLSQLILTCSISATVIYSDQSLDVFSFQTLEWWVARSGYDTWIWHLRFAFVSESQFFQVKIIAVAPGSRSHPERSINRVQQLRGPFRGSRGASRGAGCCEARLDR